MQAELDKQAQDTKMQMIQQAIQGATSTVSNLVQASKNKQRDAFVKDLSDYAANQVPKQNVTLPQAGPMLPDYNNIVPSAPVAGSVGDRTSQFPGAPGQVGTSQPGMQALPDVQTQIPDYKKMNAARAAVQLDPKSAADNYIKGQNPTASSSEEIKNVVMPDGSIGMVRINKLTGEVKPINGVQGTGVTPAQRQQQLEIGQQNADTRGENAHTNQSRFVTVTGNKFADATDVTKMADYSRLTAAKRLNQFVDQIKTSATGFQMKEASSLLASILQGGGKGTPIAEKLIDQMTPSTLKGTAMQKLEWLTNNPKSVDQGKFLELMANTGDREAVAAEDNLRQHQAEAVNKYGKKLKSLDPKRYNDVMSSAGLSEDNIDEQGRFIRTPSTRSLLPNYHDVVKQGKGTDLGGGFSYTVK
jgi:hypothetical protein